MSDKELQQLTAQWRAVLRLQDWDVKVRFAHTSDMSGHNRGECRTNMNEKSAEILLIPTGDSEDKPEELTLIHELLHIHINTLDVRDERGTEEEQVINTLAKALYGLAVSLRDKIAARKTTSRRK